MVEKMPDDKLIYGGKSKDVYEILEGEHAGQYRFVFTDRATGYMDGGKPVFDPGYDVVVGDIPGKGAIACRFATHFFKLLEKKKIPTHYIDTVGENEMIVKPATPIGLPAAAPEFEGSAPLQNLEFTWRNNATGSFWRRYPFVKPGKNLDKVVEAWTKGDSDTLITYEALEAAGAMTWEEIAYAKKLVKDIAAIVSDEFTSKGLHIIDGKFELGRLKGGDGKIVLIDEISPDVLRVCRGYTPDAKGDCTSYRECIKTKVSGGKRKITGKNQLTAKEVEKTFLN
jgi:phosphoribosylaminoimidazole-succinocarboxamide synthase